MLKLFLRLHALKDWLRDRSKRVTPRRFRRVGGILVSLILSFFSVGSVHAGDTVGALAPVIDPMNTIFDHLAYIAFAIAGFLTQGIVLMIDMMVPIMTYNSFVTNPVVSAGWAIVRDTVNMFFVIVLIIIAFGTIFGHSKFQWSQQVPKLLTFAIVINFSKTLCGIMIDFGQVIMLTFANALREIAAGNFIQLLGLSQLYSVSEKTQAVKDIAKTSGEAMQSTDFLAAGVMSVLLTLWVLGTLIMLVVILLYRIIGLWVLVVISPLAWFVGGAGGSSGIIQSNGYADWWNKFKCLVGIGPVLTFFLWLTLAVAGSGQDAESYGFTVSANNASDLGSTLLEPAHFMSFLIGMAMLFAGFDAAQQLCSSLAGGVLGKSLQRAKSGALQKGAAALGLKAAGKGLSVGARGIRRAPSAAVTVASYLPGSAVISGAYGRARESVKTGLGGATQQLGKVTRIRTLERAGVSYQAKAKAQGGLARTEDMKKAKEGMKGKSREEKLDLMTAFANQVGRGGSLSIKEDAQYKALLDEVMGDKRMQKEARATGLLDRAWKQKGNEFQKDNAHDAAKLDSINDFKKANADITKSSGLIANWDDAKGLNDDALKDKDVQERLKKVKSTIRGIGGEYLSAYDAIEQGHAGENKQKSMVVKGEGERYERMTDQELARVDVQVISQQGSSDGIRKAIEAAMRAGDEGRARTLMSYLGARANGAKDPGERMQIISVMREAAGNVRGMPSSQGTKDHFNRVTRGADETIKRDVEPLEKQREEKLAPVRQKITEELEKLASDLSTARAQINQSATQAEEKARDFETDPNKLPEEKRMARADAEVAKEAAKPENIDKAPAIVNILNQITTKEAQKANPTIDPTTDEGKEFAKIEAQLKSVKEYLKTREDAKNKKP